MLKHDYMALPRGGERGSVEGLISADIDRGEEVSGMHGDEGAKLDRTRANQD